MKIVNMTQARYTLSRLVEAIEQGRESEIVVARYGRPVARLVPLETMPTGKRIGIAKGVFDVPDSIDAHSTEITRLFLGAGSS